MSKKKTKILKPVIVVVEDDPAGFKKVMAALKRMIDDYRRGGDTPLPHERKEQMLASVRHFTNAADAKAYLEKGRLEAGEQVNCIMCDNFMPSAPDQLTKAHAVELFSFAVQQNIHCPRVWISDVAPDEEEMKLLRKILGADIMSKEMLANFAEMSDQTMHRLATANDVRDDPRISVRSRLYLDINCLDHGLDDYEQHGPKNSAVDRARRKGQSVPRKGKGQANRPDDGSLEQAH